MRQRATHKGTTSSPQGFNRELLAQTLIGLDVLLQRDGFRVCSFPSAV
jgi:hypothetical protein